MRNDFTPESHLLKQGNLKATNVTTVPQRSRTTSSFVDLKALEAKAGDPISYVSLENFSVEVLAAIDVTPDPPSVAEAPAQHQRVSVAMPTNLKWPPLQSGRQPASAQVAKTPSLSKQERQEAIMMLLNNLKGGVVGSVLSRQGLEAFLKAEIDSMWNGEALDITRLWEEFQTYTMFTKSMLLATFAQLHEKRKSCPLPLSFPTTLQQELQHASSVAKKHKRHHQASTEAEPSDRMGGSLSQGAEPAADELANAFAIPDSIWDDLANDPNSLAASMEEEELSTSSSTAKKSMSPLMWVVVAAVLLGVVFSLLF